jgi:exodeoxyribonuclease VII small subunit
MPEKRTFEQSMSELEAIVKRLEAGDMPLEESLKSFEKGIGLVRECESLLEEVKGKVEKLIRESGGAAKTVPFEPRE